MGFNEQKRRVYIYECVCVPLYIWLMRIKCFKACAHSAKFLQVLYALGVLKTNFEMIMLDRVRWRVKQRDARGLISM